MIDELTAEKGMAYVRRKHAAARTDDYVFSQLIPYIGNKRKLLDLISRALDGTEMAPGATFLDMFAGSGVVSRLAKARGYRVISNDWEPYARAINGCCIVRNRSPQFSAFGGYRQAIDVLNGLDPREDWVTRHLCPRDDEDYDEAVDRMFFMRKNGMRIDAIRHQIQQWHDCGAIDEAEADCLLAPLLYQTCYVSNTSGVFKAFHKGWGGKTGTALYRIAGDLELSPAVLCDNGCNNEVLCMDAEKAAEVLSREEITVAYLDPPYNQHPYGSNYHVLNSVALWDKPELSRSITPGNKSAIRLDWRTARRSAYNYAGGAAAAYRRLLAGLNARFVLTSYSTDGMIPLAELMLANTSRGHVHVEMKGYKRYRVSSQRFSRKPMNVEFVVVLDTHRSPEVSPEELVDMITAKEDDVLKNGGG